MGFAIIADLPLGTYRGHLGDGHVDLVPSPARLAAALLCAAAQGPRAVPDSDMLHPCVDDLAALHWLERHPPDGMRVPGLHVNRVNGVAYRTELLRKSAAEVRFAKAAKPMANVAVDGGFAWTWDAPPPEPVRVALEALCPDVSHLGMAETPVRLSVGQAEPTHNLDLHANWWDTSAGAVDVSIPIEGRAQALLDAYLADNATTVRPADDRVRMSGEQRYKPRLVDAGLGEARYALRERRASTTPWAHVLLAELDLRVPDAYRVTWAVATHRALIGLVGDGAPPVLTGVYGPGVGRPANRCAIHLLGDEGRQVGAAPNTSVLALMIPAGTDAEDLAAVLAGWRQLREVRGPGGRRLILRRRAERPADEFWPAVPAGCRRLWRTIPAAVPEIRDQRRGWSLADTVAVSVGLVLRDELVGSATGRGSAWYRMLADAARERGLGVDSVTRIKDGNAGRFVHKVSDGLLIQPYQALLDLGELAGPRALLAIGQSRHLGCGLLVPFDVPTTADAEWEGESQLTCGTTRAIDASSGGVAR